jgi:hypothetical protein
MKRMVTGDATERVDTSRASGIASSQHGRDGNTAARHVWLWIAWIASLAALLGSVTIAR